MSIEYMTKVFKTNLKPTPKLVLLTMADYANDEGKLFPSLKSLSEKASVGKSTLALILNVFEKLNIITREQRKRANGSDTSTLYTIQNLNKIDDKLYTKEYQKLRNYSQTKRKTNDKKKMEIPQCEHPIFHNVDTTQIPQCRHLKSSLEEKEEIKKYIKKISANKINFENVVTEFVDFLYLNNPNKIKNRFFYEQQISKSLLSLDDKTLENFKPYFEHKEQQKFINLQDQKRRTTNENISFI